MFGGLKDAFAGKSISNEPLPYAHQSRPGREWLKTAKHI